MKKKIGIVFYISICLLFLLSTVSLGYLDPSAMTYMIQVAAAIVIAMSTGVGIILYKIKRKFFKKKKDKNTAENEKKEK